MRCSVDPIHGVTLRVSPDFPQCAQSPCPIQPTIASPKGHAFLSLLSARLNTDVTTTRPKLDMKRRTDTPHDTQKWHGTSRTQRNAVTHAMRRGENLFACCLIIPLRMAQVTGAASDGYPRLAGPMSFPEFLYSLRPSHK